MNIHEDNGPANPPISKVQSEAYTTKFIRFMDMKNYLENIAQLRKSFDVDEKNRFILGFEKKFPEYCKKFNPNEILYEFEITNRTQSWR
jgi:hypothetical protein